MSTMPWFLFRLFAYGLLSGLTRSLRAMRRQSQILTCIRLCRPDTHVPPAGRSPGLSELCLDPCRLCGPIRGCASLMSGRGPCRLAMAVLDGEPGLFDVILDCAQQNFIEVHRRPVADGLGHFVQVGNAPHHVLKTVFVSLFVWNEHNVRL